MIAWRISRKINAALHQRRRRGAFRKPFSGKSARRLLLLTIGERIPQSQIFPFHYYARDFRDALDTEIREVEITDYVAGLPDGPRDATTVCFQTPFDIPDDELARTLAAIREKNPQARLAYLDWFAPTDLRMAHRLPGIDYYVTKHVLRDRDRYARPVYGDTTLMDYYGRKYDLPHDETRFPIPPGFRSKLHLGPSFVTADFMLPAFAAGQRPDGPRPIDLHARIAVGGSPWYEAMRAESLAAAESLPDTENRHRHGHRPPPLHLGTAAKQDLLQPLRLWRGLLARLRGRADRRRPAQAGHEPCRDPAEHLRTRRKPTSPCAGTCRISRKRPAG